MSLAPSSTLRNSPAELRDALSSSASTLVSDYCRALVLVRQLRDYDRAGRVYVRRVEAFLQAELPLTVAERAALIEHFYALSVEPVASEISWRLRCRFLRALTSLIKHKDATSAYSATGAVKVALLEHGLRLDWRPLYELLESVNLTKPFEPNEMGLLYSHSAVGDLSRAVSAARHFFPPAAVEEVWALVKPMVEPAVELDSRAFFGQAVAYLFVPTQYGDEEHTAVWAPDVLRWVLRFPQQRHFTTTWLLMLARGKKHAMEHVDVDSHLRQFAAIWLQHLRVSVGGTEQPRTSAPQPPAETLRIVGSKGHNDMSRALSKLLVYSLAPEKTIAIKVLRQLLRTLATYFHPSNSNGRWSTSLANFVVFLAGYYVQRYRAETFPGDWFHVPDASKLDYTQPIGFVEAITPTLFTAMYSKSGSMLQAVSIFMRHVAPIHPDLLVTPILERAQNDLETVTETERMHAMLQVLSSVAQVIVSPQLYPLGPAHLEKLLWQMLPGIDATDVMKTAKTLTFCASVFTHVPFISGDAQKELPREENDSFDSARRTTFLFEEWSIAFAERVLHVLGHLGAFSKKSQLDLYFQSVISRVATSFFASLSEPIFRSVFARVLRFAVSESVDNRKGLGELFGSAGHCHPKAALEMAFAELLGPITEHNDTFLENHLYFIGKVVKRAGGDSGDAALLLEYQPRIAELVKTALAHESKSMRKVGGRLLRKTLMGLTEIYATDLRPFPKAEWDSPTWAHWRDWSRFADKHLPREPGVTPDVHMAWHFPTGAEVAAAQSWVADLLEDALAKASDDALDFEALNTALNVIFQIVRGAHTGLGLLGSPWATADADGGDSGARVEIANPELAFVAAIPTLDSGIPGTTLRERLADATTQLGSKLVAVFAESPQKTNVKSLTMVAKISSALLHVGLVQSKHGGAVALNRRIRSALTVATVSRVCGVRKMLVEHEEALLNERLSLLENGDLTQNPRASELLALLRTLAVFEFAKVRAKARPALVVALRTYPQGNYATMRAALDVIGEEEPSQERLDGAILLLQASAWWVARDAKRVAEFSRQLFEHGQRHDDLVQLQLQQLFESMYSSLHMLPTRIESTEIERRNTAIASRNRTLEQSHEQLVTTLLDCIDNDTIHWRYELMARATLLPFVNPRHPPTVRLLQTLVDGLVHGHTSGRVVSMYVLTAIATAFVDEEGRCSLSEEALATLRPLVAEHVDKVVQVLVDDHPGLQPEASGEATQRRHQRRGFSDHIAALATSWVRTGRGGPRFHADGFDTKHAAFVRALVRLFPADAAEPLLAAARSNIDPHKRECNVTAAELLSGMLIAGVPEATIRDALSDALAKCPPDAVEDFRGALTHACFWASDYGTDLQWLVRLLVDRAVAVDAEAQLTPSAQSKRLVFAKAALGAALKRRACAYAPELCESALRQLAESSAMSMRFDKVRSGISDLLALTFTHSSAEVRDDVLSSCVAELLVREAAKSGGSSDADTESVEAQHHRLYMDTLLLWTMSSLRSCHSASKDLWPKIMGTCLQGLGHKNEQLAARAGRCLLSMAWAQHPATGDFVTLMDAVQDPMDGAADWSWKSRVGVLHFTSVFFSRHSPLVKKKVLKTAVKRVEGLLKDDNQSVRTAAGLTLTAIIACQPHDVFEKQREKLLRRFVAAAAGESGDDSKPKLVVKHSGALGLAAIVTSEPYEVPDFIPAAVAALADHVTGPDIVRKCVRTCVAEFLRTHRERWAEFKDCFTEEQLDRVMAVSSAPSYFA